MLNYLVFVDWKCYNFFMQGLTQANVWIGAGVQVMPGVTIGNDVVIGGGSVVTKDIPDHSVAYGNPCRVV